MHTAEVAGMLAALKWPVWYEFVPPRDDDWNLKKIEGQNDGVVTLTIKRLPGGLVTNWLHDQLEEGAVLGLTEAFGDFLMPAMPKPVLFIAGGSGITPILSLLETMAAEHFRAPVTLLYFVRTQEDVIASEKLEALAARYSALSVRIICTHETDEPRYLNDADLDSVPGLKAREVYLCGPGGLMDLANDLLYQRGLGEEQIHCTFFAPPISSPLGDETLGGEVSFARADLNVDSSGDATLLEIAEAAGLQVRLQPCKRPTVGGGEQVAGDGGARLALRASALCRRRA